MTTDSLCKGTQGTKILGNAVTNPLYGDSNRGKVLEIRSAPSQSWRCEYIGPDGRRCNNPRLSGYLYCAICRELMSMKEKEVKGNG